jgi:hypothetical protein
LSDSEPKRVKGSWKKLQNEWNAVYDKAVSERKAKESKTKKNESK